MRERNATELLQLAHAYSILRDSMAFKHSESDKTLATTQDTDNIAIPNKATKKPYEADPKTALHATALSIHDSETIPCFTELIDEIKENTASKSIETPSVATVEDKQANKVTTLNDAIEKKLISRTEGNKKVSAQLRVSNLAEVIGCSTTHLIGYIRNNLSDLYTLMKGAEIPKLAIHSTGSMKKRPFYVVPNRLLGK